MKPQCVTVTGIAAKQGKQKERWPRKQRESLDDWEESVGEALKARARSEVVTR